MRDRYEEILSTGANVVAIGTGGRRYAAAFIDDEQVPFDVLVDEDGSAAEIAGTKRLGLVSLTRPSALKAGIRSRAAGHRQSKTGRRPFQLGATLVIGPGDELIFADFEDHAGDHADIDEVLAAIKQ